MGEVEGKYKYNMGGLNKEREVEAKYKYNVGLDDSRRRNEVVEFVPLVPEKQKQKSVDQPRNKEQIVSNEIPLVSVTNRQLGLGKSSSPSKGFRGSSSTRGYHASTSPKDFLKKRYKSPHLSKATSRIYSKEGGAISKAALYKTILASYSKSTTDDDQISIRANKGLGKGLYSKSRAKRRLRKSRRSKRPRNCHVSSWGEWGPCSKSCGIGESVRKRTVVQTARHGGSACPKLIDFRWCGSARNACKAGYFRW